MCVYEAAGYALIIVLSHLEHTIRIIERLFQWDNVRSLFFFFFFFFEWPLAGHFILGKYLNKVSSLLLLWQLNQKYWLRHVSHCTQYFQGSL